MIDFGTIFSQGLDSILVYLSQFAPNRLGFNFLDVLIVVIVLFYAYEGYVLGFLLASLDLLSFIGSFIIALKVYPFVGDILTSFFALPMGFANAIGFFLSAFITEVFLNFISRKIYKQIHRFHIKEKLATVVGRFDHWLGVLPGLLSAGIILAFLLTVIVSLPSSPVIKELVTKSQFGSRLIGSTSLFEKQLNNIFGGALDETITFVTVRPQSQETIDLQSSVVDGKIDGEEEQAMFHLVNEERKKEGLSEVAFDNALRDVARAHSTDMFVRGYFSHYTPDGLSPFDRMNAAGIAYSYAGENLALAPSTPLAMQGLMESPGHRANILNPNFRKVGIGVIDGGIYGKMYTQEFTD